MSGDFKGKVVIVTGSSSGIGEDAVVTFAKLGAQVVVTGRNGQRVSTVATRCNEVSPDDLIAFEVVGDIADDQDAKALIENTVTKFGRLDVLVNNAGISVRLPITSSNIVESLDRIYRTNVRALVNLIQIATPHLIKTKGNIVNVSSVASSMPSWGGVPYSSSKAAVDMITRTLALELTPLGVRINAINPGLIKTPIFEGFPEFAIAKYTNLAENVYPVRRIGDVKDTTRAILFLASEGNSFLTGVLLPVDGGYKCTTTAMDFAKPSQ